MDVTVQALTGSARQEALPALAALRIAVFRDWPYLYDGTIEHEQDYLVRFAAAEGSVIVAARAAGDTVGAATAAPLRAHTSEFVPLFEQQGFDPDRIFYLGESVLLPTYRGRGIGHRFFDLREAHARATTGPKGAYSHTAFCGVVRPDGHSLQPTAYTPLDAFWEKRGYRKVPGLVGSYSWKDVDQSQETGKPMQFWIKAL